MRDLEADADYLLSIGASTLQIGGEKAATLLPVRCQILSDHD